MVDEFRNHLQRLAAGTVQVRDGLPRSVASLLAPTLVEMETTVDSLSVLTSWMNAVVNPGAPGAQVISDIDDVIERALAMARPFIHAEVRVAVGGRVGAVRNRRGGVECALAALLVSLDRGAAPLLPQDTRQDLEQGLKTGLKTGPKQDPRLGPRKELTIEVFSGRGYLVIEIESNGGQPSPSWRWSLAERLAAMVGGTLEPLPEKVGVGLRFQ